MRIKITNKHYDSQKLKNFLDELESDLVSKNFKIGTVNIYINIKNENGESIELVEDNKIMNFKTKFVKDEEGKKVSRFAKWLF